MRFVADGICMDGNWIHIGCFRGPFDPSVLTSNGILTVAMGVAAEAISARSKMPLDALLRIYDQFLRQRCLVSAVGTHNPNTPIIDIYNVATLQSYLHIEPTKISFDKNTISTINSVWAVSRLP